MEALLWLGQFAPIALFILIIGSLILIFMDNAPATNKVALIKNLYLYLVSFVALMMVAFSVADVINIGLRAYIFTKADKDFYSYPEPLCAPTKPVSPGATSTSERCLTSEDQEKRSADNRAAQRQRDLVRDLSFVLVGIPLFAYHWRLVRSKRESSANS